MLYNVIINIFPCTLFKETKIKEKKRGKDNKIKIGKKNWIQKEKERESCKNEEIKNSGYYISN